MDVLSYAAAMAAPIEAFRQALAQSAARGLELPEDLIPEIVSQMRTPDPGHGDLALPCFTLGKQAKKNPTDVAKQVVSYLADDPRWSAVSAAGPYVNVRFSDAALKAAVVEAARAPAYGQSSAGEGRTAVIDFSAPNIAKPLAFHHIRSTVIGAAIARIHAACGYRTVGINYLGDWGKQFGLLATGFKRHGDPARRHDAKHLVEVYVKANQDADTDTPRALIERPAEARALAERLEAARAALAATTAASTTATNATPEEKKRAAKSAKSLETKLRALRGLGENDDPTTDFDAYLVTLEAAAEAARPALARAEEHDREARLYLKRLEDQDEEALAEWREFRSTSIAEFERVYARMGVAFTYWEGEASYQSVLEQTVERVRARPGTEMSDGAEIVALPRKPNEVPVLLKTRDGTTLYITRDIATAIDRYERFSFDRSLYVVGEAQSLHFEQLFRTLTAMGYDWVDRCQHVKFGRVHGMSTRRGQVVFLDEVLDEAVAKAREICEKSGRIDPATLDDVVESIGIGAIVFGDLRNPRASDYRFDWSEVLDFSGHTGPYIQYSHARACSILRKAEGGIPETADLDRLTLDEERALILALARFPDAVLEACNACEPSLLTRAIIEIAGAAAHYLTAGNKDRDKRVLTEDDDVRAARLHLVDALRQTLASGLALLGLKAPESM
ncbi:MAG: arginine--tRNA ligase [Deltaproteobacteria bacterium]|nr:arginine--tRNA ligase [Deltaproteobacteria bacterium]